MGVDSQHTEASAEPDAGPPPVAALADRMLRETVLGFSARLAKVSEELQALRGEFERDVGATD